MSVLAQEKLTLYCPAKDGAMPSKMWTAVSILAQEKLTLYCPAKDGGLIALRNVDSCVNPRPRKADTLLPLKRRWFAPRNMDNCVSPRPRKANGGLIALRNVDDCVNPRPRKANTLLPCKKDGGLINCPQKCGQLCRGLPKKS